MEFGGFLEKWRGPAARSHLEKSPGPVSRLPAFEIISSGEAANIKPYFRGASPNRVLVAARRVPEWRCPSNRLTPEPGQQ